jgi:hypothetical protein
LEKEPAAHKGDGAHATKEEYSDQMISIRIRCNSPQIFSLVDQHRGNHAVVYFEETTGIEGRR